MYRAGYRRRPARAGRKRLFIGLAVVLLLAAGFGAYKLLAPTPVEKAVNQLQFDASVSEDEKQTIRQAIQDQAKTYDGSVTVRAETVLESSQPDLILSAFVPITNKYATRQAVTAAELASLQVYVPADTDDGIKTALATALGLQTSQFKTLTTSLQELPDTAVALVPVTSISPSVKLLTFEGSYYLDNFQKGAIFRQAAFDGSGAVGLSDLVLNSFDNKDTMLKVNMTGVTALTRVMIKKLASVNDPMYFSQKIGAFLADADITHVSNEVSFKAGCQYHDSSFCSPPEMIEALKASGVDLVELTGNHNNDVGSQYNTDSITQYHALGWHTFGGGLNTVEAAKPFIVDQKSSKVAFLGYNQADAPGSGALATATKAGANGYSADKAQADITAAKQQGNFVIVDVQYSECYAYPGSYREFPECDQPIGGQKEAFRRYIDMGADMVIGSSAHQPQTYEWYKDKPIYYGLGNLYFDQIQQPGTERGIILTHYFTGGKLLQTKLSPTVFDAALQTHLMDDSDAVKLLQRLKTAR